MNTRRSRCAPGYWDCLIDEPTFFDGDDDYLLLDVNIDLDNSFILQLFVEPEEFGEPAGTLFSSEHIILFHNRVTGEVIAVVQTSISTLTASVTLPLETSSRVIVRVVELFDMVSLEVSVSGQLSDDDLGIGQLLVNDLEVYAGARLLPPSGFDSFFHGDIGPVGIAKDP